jgi:hypothetical protein
VAEEQMYFEAGKVWGLLDCGKGLVSSFSEAFDAAEGFLASELQNIQYLAQKESKFSYFLVFSSWASDTIR